MALEVRVGYTSGVQFTVRAREHQLICDQPGENGGSNDGMTPPELLLASLGTCAAYYAAEYLRTRHLDTTGLTVSVSAEKAPKPMRLGAFQITVFAPGCPDERHREGLLRAVNNCLIHKTLMNAPEIAIAVEAPSISESSVAPAEVVE